MSRRRRKQANGSGSIYKTKNGLYRVAVTVRDGDGTVKRIYRTARDREKAEDLLRVLLDSRDRIESPVAALVAAFGSFAP